MPKPESVSAPGPVSPAGAPVLMGVRGYAFALLCIGAALGLRLLLDPLWGDRLPYVMFFFAIVVVAQFADHRASAFAILSGLVMAIWFFVPPRHSLLVGSGMDRFNALFFIFITSIVVAFSTRTRRALARERAAQEELRRQIEAVRESEARYSAVAAIVESSDDAIISKSLEGTILSWNKGAERLYGYTSAEAVGKSIDLLLPSERGDELRPLLEQVRRGERVSHFETTRRARDGRLFSISLTISPVRNAVGEIVGASAIARDISERKAAEAEQERLFKELQAALANVKTLSGLLPICAHCKKVRDDKGYWNQIELYIRERSDAKFTHGICPDCSKELYPDLFEQQPQRLSGPATKLESPLKA